MWGIDPRVVYQVRAGTDDGADSFLLLGADVYDDRGLLERPPELDDTVLRIMGWRNSQDRGLTLYAGPPHKRKDGALAFVNALHLARYGQKVVLELRPLTLALWKEMLAQDPNLGLGEDANPDQIDTDEKLHTLYREWWCPDGFMETIAAFHAQFKMDRSRPETARPR